MIRLSRGAEPQKLEAVRLNRLAQLRSLGREPTSKEIDGYQCVSEDLWRGQYLKCCYCEQKIPEKYNDVEHYRPKTAADRTPGCVSTHGYWWLAFSWDNLLFACPACNRSAKNTGFPLKTGSSGVVAEQSDFIGEAPLLIDPYAINPVPHIVFVQVSVPLAPVRWYARPRDNSEMGVYTIKVCDLNRDELLELRQDHFETNLSERIADFKLTLQRDNPDCILSELGKLARLVKRRNGFAAFNFDVLSQLIPESSFSDKVHFSWPSPHEL